tara:strand:+ start:484 stop:891 length:408 start_codon:yes stop_codon:yes gene_type:complete
MEFIKNDGGRGKYFPAKYKKDQTSDCVVRAIAIALELDYKFVLESLFRLGLEIGCMPNSKKVYEAFLGFNGWYKNSPLKYSTSKGDKKFKVKEHPYDNCIIHTVNHLTVIKDGELNDTWDCMEWCANSYYTQGLG